MAATIEWAESTPERLASLRRVLREYLLALGNGDEFVARMLSRCTLSPHPGSAVLLMPPAPVPARAPDDRARSKVPPARAITD